MGSFFHIVGKNGDSVADGAQSTVTIKPGAKARLRRLKVDNAANWDISALTVGGKPIYSGDVIAFAELENDAATNSGLFIRRDWAREWPAVTQENPVVLLLVNGTGGAAAPTVIAYFDEA